MRTKAEEADIQCATKTGQLNSLSTRVVAFSRPGGRAANRDEVSIRARLALETRLKRGRFGA
jgi:hypothetical protein